MISFCKRMTRRLVFDQDGATATEYAVMIALIIGVCIATVNVLADATGSSFDASANAMFP